MPNIILSDTSASVSELKKNPMATVSAGDGFPVATLDDQELVKLVAERSNQPLHDVDLDKYL